ncbi:MAG: His/Gly/Thr/Pro-type tRNA ligase C-terminal domain-containing protein, partial [Clostridium butyricum]
ERIIMTLENEGIEIPNDNLIDLYIAARGEEEKKTAFKLASDLRTLGGKCEINHMGRSIKAEMKFANKLGAAFTTILGEDELANKKINLKRMSDGEIFEASLENTEEIVKIISAK